MVDNLGPRIQVAIAPASAHVLDTGNANGIIVRNTHATNPVFLSIYGRSDPVPSVADVGDATSCDLVLAPGVRVELRGPFRYAVTAGPSVASSITWRQAWFRD